MGRVFALGLLLSTVVPPAGCGPPAGPTAQAELVVPHIPPVRKGDPARGHVPPKPPSKAAKFP